jgi:DNA invertase Pin-like site-specific DNA recombinase
MGTGRSENCRENLILAASRGRHPGNLPLGYLPGIRDTDPPRPDPDTAPLIAGAFALAAEGKSLGESVRILHAWGLRSKRGNPLSRQALHAILRNPFYRGQVRLKGKLYPGAHRPLVSEELFTRTQESIRMRRL